MHEARVSCRPLYSGLVLCEKAFLGTDLLLGVVNGGRQLPKLYLQ